MASSLESESAGSPGNTVPTHLPFPTHIEPSSQLSDLAKMVCAVQTPLSLPRDFDSEDEEETDLNYLTDEDSENLISDEEDDNESGFLSQI